MEKLRNEISQEPSQSHLRREFVMQEPTKKKFSDRVTQWMPFFLVVKYSLLNQVNHLHSDFVSMLLDRNTWSSYSIIIRKRFARTLNIDRALKTCSILLIAGWILSTKQRLLMKHLVEQLYQVFFRLMTFDYPLW